MRQLLLRPVASLSTHSPLVTSRLNARLLTSPSLLHLSLLLPPSTGMAPKKDDKKASAGKAKAGSGGGKAKKKVRV